MIEYTHRQVAENIDLWDEYFNTSALMSAEDFHAMSVEERVAMLVEAFGEDEDEDEDEDEGEPA